jgi:hypothetical protein
MCQFTTLPPLMNSMEQSSWEAHSHPPSQEIPCLMEPEGSSLSQKPATGPYPGLDESSLHLPTLLP